MPKKVVFLEDIKTPWVQELVYWAASIAIIIMVLGGLYVFTQTIP